MMTASHWLRWVSVGWACCWAGGKPSSSSGRRPIWWWIVGLIQNIDIPYTQNTAGFPAMTQGRQYKRTFSSASFQRHFLLLSWTLTAPVTKKHILLPSAWEGSCFSNEIIPPFACESKIIACLWLGVFSYSSNWPLLKLPSPVNNKWHVIVLW